MEPTAPSPFWTKPLGELSRGEWERLCDGCGKCCLEKLLYEDGDLDFTRVGCRLFDVEACRCIDYGHRSRRVSGCVHLTPDNLAELGWMPATCAYRLRAEGKPLPAWHPLLTGDPDSVHAAGMSARGRAVSALPVEEWLDHVVNWPDL